MQHVEVSEGQHNKYCFIRYQGRPFHRSTPGNIRDHLQKVAGLKCRSDDVILCTYPKSGTHWVYNTTMMLRTGTLSYFGTPRVADFEDIEFIENMATPRTFLTHFTFPLIPGDAKHGVPKIIKVTRNPKDVAVSYFHFISNMMNTGFEGDFDFFLRFFLSEEYFVCGASWFTYMKEWTDGRQSHPDMKILSLSYEDFKKNTYANIVKMATFLEVNHDEKFLRAVERNITFENLKAGHAKIDGESDRWSVVDKHGKVPVYRKGCIGDWKDTFTVAQNENFNSVFREKMAGYDLRFVYE